MSTFSTQCSFCRKEFKTFYSLKKHIRERHDGVDEEVLIPAFQDWEGKPVEIPKARESLFANAKAGYIMWLAGIIESMNATFHPRLPGNFFSIYIGSLLS